jgi:hypothetical protein
MENGATPPRFPPSAESDPPRVRGGCSARPPQCRLWLRAGLVRLVFAALLAGALPACSSWHQEGDTCVKGEEGDDQRAVNYADPELCDRPVRKRRSDYVRVPPPLIPREEK